MNYNEYNANSKLFPNQATSGRDKSLYPKKDRMLLGTAGYTERECECEDQPDTGDVTTIVNLVLEQLKKDGTFDSIIVDETKIANNVVKYLQDNNMLTLDTDKVVISVINEIKNDNLFIGPKGDKGDPGADGKDGKDGVDGAPGPKGDPGQDGKDGAKGDKGDKGDPGQDGKDGAPGPKGDKGDPGADGVSPSASDVATELKSDTTFVASLKGDKGDKGDPGQDGQDGVDGAPGPKGDPGQDGAKGDKGDKGDPGQDGADGKDGVDGNVDDAINAVRNEIKKGYQQILDEEIEYGRFASGSGAVSDGQIITFANAIQEHTINLTDDGYIPLKAGKTYAISFNARIESNTNAANAYISFSAFDVSNNVEATGQQILQSENRTVNMSDGILPPTAYKPTQDGKLGIKITNAGTIGNIFYTTCYVQEIKQSVMTNVDVEDFINHTGKNNQDAPVGNVIAFMGTEAPAHYLACDGSVYNIADYQHLADHFVTAFGSVNHFGGDGTTTFAVPDLRGEFLRGTGNNSHTNASLGSNEGNGADVGEHQSATVNTSIGVSTESGNTYFSAAKNTSNWVGFGDADANSGYTQDNAFIATTGDNTNKRAALYTVRPTNTSVLYCIKYEPTYFLNVGDGAGLNSASIEEVVQYLLDNGYIVETVDPTKEEVINGLVDTIETAGYMKETASNDTLIEAAIDKLIADNKITIPTNDGGSDGTEDFKNNIKTTVFSKVGTLANYETTINKLINVIDEGGYYNSTVSSTEAADMITYLKGQNLIDYQAPTKKQEIKDFLMNSTIFDAEDFDVNNAIPVAIQQLKDAGLLGSSVNVQDVSDAVSGDLKDNGFMDGYAKETYVDTAVKEAKDKAEADLIAHTEAMKEQIKKGYQNILDEEIGYLVAGKTPSVIYNAGSILTFTSQNVGTTQFARGNGKIEVDSDGYIKLRAGKLYMIHPNIMINSTGTGVSSDVGYNITDKNGNVLSVGNLCRWAEASAYSDAIFPDLYMPEEDCAIAITLSNKSNIYQYSISVLEIKQPVITEVTVGSYVDHVGLDCQDSPVGNIISFMGNTAPAHYLACDGTEYNIIDYPELANHFINEFGTVNHFGGNGTITFAVPDLRGEFLRGTSAAARNTGSGSNVGEHQDPTLEQNVFINNNSSWVCKYFVNGQANTYLVNPDKEYPVGVLNSDLRGLQINADKTYNPSVQSIQHSTRPTNTSVMWCIKYESTYVINFENELKTYSANEHIVGTWKNGKVLYEKTVTVNVPGTSDIVSGSTNLRTTTPHGISNPEYIFVKEAFMYQQNTPNVSWPLPWISIENTDYDTHVYVNPVNILCETRKQPRVGMVAEVTIRYTKTS